MYLVEIYTSKEVWEIQEETDSRAVAMSVFDSCTHDGYNTRITRTLAEPLVWESRESYTERTGFGPNREAWKNMIELAVIKNNREIHGASF